MKSRGVFLTGWAHEPDALAPLHDALLASHTLTGGELMSDFDEPVPSPFDVPPVAIGWSAGAIRALDAAVRGRPLSALILISGAARFCASPDVPRGVPPARLRALRAALRATSARAAMEAFHRDCAWPGDPGAEELTRRADRSLALGIPALIAGLDYLRDADLTGGCVAVRVPTLLLHGADDRVIPAAASDALRARMPHAELEIVPGAGHRIPLDEPDRVADRIHRFLKGVFS